MFLMSCVVRFLNSIFVLSFRKSIHSVFFFLLITQQTDLRANISNSFSESIPYLSSGRFIYDTLDFLTTPFLYNLQTSDAVSLKFTRRNVQGNRDREEGLFGSARISIFTFPVYLAVNLIASSTTTNVEPPTTEAAPVVVEENSLTNYRFMLGSHFGTLGVAGYVILSRDRTTSNRPSSALNTQLEESYNKNAETVDSLYRPRGNSYGIELGQSALPIPVAWTLSVEYRETAGVDFVQTGEGDDTSSRRRFGAPGSIFSEDLIPNFDQSIGLLLGKRGNNRQEIRSNFLGWYTIIQKKLNVGFSYSLTVPFASGRNSNRQFSQEGNDISSILSDDGFPLAEETPRTTNLSGHDISVTVFADNDFYFGSDQSLDQKVVTPASIKDSIFRITPAITYRNLKDTLFYNEGHSFVGNYEYLSLDLNFRSQIVFGEKKNMILYLNWLPKVVFIQSYHSIIRAAFRKRVNDNNPVEVNSRRRLDSPNIVYSTFGVGFSYLFFGKLKLNLAWSPNSSGTHVDFSNFDLGIDYTF